MNTVYIHAPNIHNGGGKTLLDSVLACGLGGTKWVLQLDERARLDEEALLPAHVRWVRPTVWGRFRAEWWLRRHVRAGDTLFSFGNLPPLFRSPGRVVVFIQNKYLLESHHLRHLPFLTRIRLSLERCWLRWRLSVVDQFIVQTPSMQRALLALLAARQRPLHEGQVRVLPFLGSASRYARKRPEDDNELPHISESTELRKKFDFVYVASGEWHKNHDKLVEAWCVLADQGLYPSLCLTVSSADFPALCARIAALTARAKLRITNAGALPHGQVLELYGRAGALIYPSVFESFGIPLIEARQAGLAILAAELDYVRDVLDPEQSFNPASVQSIAQAVKRHLQVQEPELPLIGGIEFMRKVLGQET